MSQRPQEVLLSRELNGPKNQPLGGAVFHFDPEALLKALVHYADSDERLHGSGPYVDACRRLNKLVADFIDSGNSTLNLAGPDCYVFEEYLMISLLDKGALDVECRACSRKLVPEEVSVNGEFPSLLQCPAGHTLFRTASYIR